MKKFWWKVYEIVAAVVFVLLLLACGVGIGGGIAYVIEVLAK
jgi:hypothetical protein